MTRLLPAAVLLAVLGSPPAGAQPAPGDGVGRLVGRVQTALELGDPALYMRLLAPGADPDNAAGFAGDWFRAGTTRALVRERDRAELPGGRSGREYELYVDVLVESGRAGRVGRWRLVVRRTADAPASSADEEWGISDQEAIATVEGIHRLALNPARQYTVANLTISAEDLQLRLPLGTAFVAQTDAGPTAIVLLGRGEAVFSPAPEAERGQLRIFCGSEVLQTRFDALFIRVNPDEIGDHMAAAAFQERAVDPQDLKRADEIFRHAVVNSYNLGLGDLSGETWSVMPAIGDFLADIRTPRYSELTYGQFTNESEDIQLFERARSRTISMYASKARLAARGPFYDEDDQRDYDVLNYDIDASFQPAREWIDGHARLLVRTRRDSLTSLMLRLADPFVVQSVESRRLGRLLSLRVTGQDEIVVNLPEAVPRDTVVDVEVTYSGHLPAVPPEREVLLPAQETDAGPLASPTFRREPSYAYSGRSYWYPQGMVTDYATATMRLRVPADDECVASGDLDEGSPTLIPPLGPGGSGWKEYRFVATQPVRYLGWAISRFVRVDSFVVTPDLSAANGAAAGEGPAPSRLPGASYNVIQLVAEANPSQQRRGRDMARRADEVVKFYASTLGDVPYPSLTLALIERDLPGGHSPPYVAMLNQPVASARISWRNDPANFEDFPDFFLAHEVAHQWWGQAVGWKNFHEQWLSEGLAQYFAALFAERFRGKDVFAGIIRQMQQWTMKESDQGPVYLGYRLGHIQRDTKIFRAVVYNKGALVLHMMRRLIGDEAFFRALRRFYATWRFRKAGTEDLKRAFETESHRSLDRFFERWIYRSTLPTIRFSYRAQADAVVLRFEQLGDVFDLPVTVTLQYADRPSSDVIVPVTDQVAEVRVPLAGTLRRVEVNRDEAAPAVFVR
jgi:hypothetical protein